RQLAALWARQMESRPFVLHALMLHFAPLMQDMLGESVVRLRRRLSDWVPQWGRAGVAFCLQMDARVTVRAMATHFWQAALGEEGTAFPHEGRERETVTEVVPEGDTREQVRKEKRQRRLLAERDQQIARQGRELASLRERLNQLERERVRLLEAVHALENDKASLAGQLEATRQQLARLQDEDRGPAWEDKIAGLTAALAQAEAQVAEHQQTAAQLARRLQEAEARLHEADRQVQAKEVQLAELRARVAQREMVLARMAGRPEPEAVLEDLVSSLERATRQLLGQIADGECSGSERQARQRLCLLLAAQQLLSEGGIHNYLRDGHWLEMPPEAEPLVGRVTFVPPEGSAAHTGVHTTEVASGSWVAVCSGFEVRIPERLARGLRLLEGDEVSLLPVAGSIRLQLHRRVPRRQLLGCVSLGDSPLVRTVEGEEWPLLPGEVESTEVRDGDPVTVEVTAEEDGSCGKWARLVQVHPAEIPEEHRPRLRLSGKDIRRLRSRSGRSEPSAEVEAAAVAGAEMAETDVFPGTWLKDWRVLVVGGDGQEARYRHAIEERAGVFDWSSGFDGLKPLPGKVKACDMVVLVTARMSHKASDLVRDTAERFKKKLLYCNELGTGALLRCLAGALGQSA
ncbi:MAG TPA: DUF2325 domain-containing protein, partial [Firmicutes bacterium]|nr:DUF2325 domain-containing protein [Bacillota bacterium]